LTRAVEALGIPVLGSVPRDNRLNLPERHLGLVQASEHDDLEQVLEAAADHFATAVDVDALLALARPQAAMPSSKRNCAMPPIGQRIAVASDSVFAFTYPALLEDWRVGGAELRSFSPVADEAPSTDADAVYLPGGYPELRGGQLAANRNFLAGLRAAAHRGA